MPVPMPMAGAVKQPLQSPSGEPLRRRLPQEEWAVLIQDVYPAYLSWAGYLDNQARLAANRSRFLPGPGSVRQGQALLTGLVVCAQCGRHLGTIYNPAPWYTCTRAKLRYGEPPLPTCKAEPVDRIVSELFLAAVQPGSVGSRPASPGATRPGTSAPGTTLAAATGAGAL